MEDEDVVSAKLIGQSDIATDLHVTADPCERKRLGRMVAPVTDRVAREL
jgi:hypothetical protein